MCVCDWDYMWFNLYFRIAVSGFWCKLNSLIKRKLSKTKQAIFWTLTLHATLKKTEKKPVIFEISNKIQNTDFFFFNFLLMILKWNSRRFVVVIKGQKALSRGKKNYHTLFLTFNFPSNIILAHFQFFFFF